MNFKLILLFLVFGLSFQQTIRTLTTVGAGYNIYEANPLFSTKEDEGLRLSGNVFNLSYSKNKTTGDGKYQIADQVESGGIYLCYGQSEQFSFSGMQGYFQASESSLSAGIEIPLASFSMSVAYKQTESSLQVEKNLQFSSKLVCPVYQLSLERPQDTPLSQNFIDLLMNAYSSSNYTLFIKKYGTHYIDSCIQGGRISSQQRISYENYALLTTSEYDVKEAARLTYQLSIGQNFSNSSQEAKAKQAQSFFQSDEILATPPLIGNYSEWEKGVQNDVQPIKYTINNLEYLVSEKYFPKEEVSKIKESMKKGFEEYCQQNNKTCKTPKQDPNWPDKASSNVSLYRQNIGISNMDALINGKIEKGYVPQFTFNSNTTNSITPDYQITQIQQFCHQTRKYLQGIKYQICSYNKSCYPYSFGKTNEGQRLDWNIQNLGTPINKVSYVVGGPSPYITKLNFYNSLGSIYPNEQYMCMGINSDFDVLSTMYDFQQNIVGFYSRMDSSIEYAVRQIEFYVNDIKYNFTNGSLNTPKNTVTTQKTFPPQNFLNKDILLSRLLSKSAPLKQNQSNSDNDLTNNQSNSNNGCYFTLYNLNCPIIYTQVISNNGYRYQTPTTIYNNQKQISFVYDTSGTYLNLRYYGSISDTRIGMEDPSSNPNSMTISNYDYIQRCYGIYGNEYAPDGQYSGGQPFTNVCYTVC